MQTQIDDVWCILELHESTLPEDNRALRDFWIPEEGYFVLVYSIESRSSFTSVQKFHHEIQRVNESAGTPKSLGPPPQWQSMTGNPTYRPLILVGNKCDEVIEREVSTQEGSVLAKELGCDFVEASAKYGINVEEAFYDVVRHLRRIDRQRQAEAENTKEKRPSFRWVPMWRRLLRW